MSPLAKADRGRTNTDHFGNFIEFHAGEKLELDHTRLAFVQRRKAGQRIVERDEFVGLLRQRQLVVEIAAQVRIRTLGGEAAARVVDENPAHGLRRDRGEVGAGLPLRAVLADEADEGLMHQRRGPQGVLVAFAAQRAPRKLAQRRIDQRRDSGQRGLFAGAQRLSSVVISPGSSMRFPRPDWPESTRGTGWRKPQRKRAACAARGVLPTRPTAHAAAQR